MQTRTLRRSWIDPAAARRHPFDNRRRFRLLLADATLSAKERLVAEGYGHDADAAFDALIAYANATLPLGIRRTGDKAAISAGGSPIVFEEG